jgi:thiol-disulfide isomerase/thioredoxin
MQTRLILCMLLAASAAWAAIVRDVRAAVARGDFAGAEALVAGRQKQQGLTPELLEAMSWLGRGALAAKQYDRAHAYARKTQDLAVAELRKRPLDQEPHLPNALGAAIEVQAHVLAAGGERSAAVSFLDRELKRYYKTSIRTRIQKNIHLLSLEGKPAPAIELREYLGPNPVPLTALKGKPVLLFLWAHWCGDCKGMIPILSQIQSEFGDRLKIVAPTQRYGYIARGEEAGPAAELKYIDQVRQELLAPKISNLPVPVGEETFKNYGVSTTPTLVLVDARGLVRLYRPGKMPYEELRDHIRRLTAPPATD